MANVVNGNTYFVDTASGSGGAVLDEKQISVSYVILTSNGSAGQLIAEDNDSGIIKLSLRLPAAVVSQVFDFSANPILFPNGIDPSTVTNVQAMFIYKRQGGGR